MGHQLSYILVVIVLPSVFILICGITAYAVSRNHSLYFKLTTWGMFSVFLISPVLSFVVGHLALIILDDGWAGIGFFIFSLEVAEAISILLVILGIVGYTVTKYKNNPKRPKVQNTDS